ncbi:MAG: queuosine precursor transporter [Candidatus Izemoplasmataceae bacterium]
MNELLWLSFAILNFLCIVAVYKLFGKTGLFAWIAVGTIIANIQVTKTVELFGMTATLGNIMYGTLFLATDALNERYGLKDAKRAVYLGFFTMVTMVVIMQVALLFTPGPDDFAHDALTTIFEVVPRIVLGSLTAYIVSQLLDVHLFQKIRSRYPSKGTLYLRNIGSTMMSQLVDSAIFVPIAFLGLYDTPVLLSILFTTYIIKLIVAVLDTPFIYLMQTIRPIDERPEA